MGMLVLTLGGDAAFARVFLTVEEALALAFPAATVERETVYLTDAQREQAGRLSGEPVESALLIRYRARREGEDVGTAYFDTHVVRTLAETIMVVVEPSGELGRVEVLTFDEPAEYLPRRPWYAQFPGRPLDDELSLTGAIRPVTGATLTARATTAAARRVLALHRLLVDRER